jgi:hypothetical protein
MEKVDWEKFKSDLFTKRVEWTTDDLNQMYFELMTTEYEIKDSKVDWGNMNPGDKIGN